MLNDIFIFAASLFLVVRSATFATRYAGRLASGFRLSPYTIGFIVVAVISILPETFISLSAALEGVPSFGLGMLFGSNIADLTLVFAGIMLLTGRGLKIESKILRNHTVYPFLLLLPLILGLDGHLSRLEGLALIVAGIAFYVISFRNGAVDGSVPVERDGKPVRDSLLLLASMAVLLIGAHFTVTSATALAAAFGVSPLLIGMLVVALGTTLPEFFFSLKSAKRGDDSLAVGDVLGTVLADATVVVGILALIAPFSFSPTIIYVSGAFMVVASLLLFSFMRSGRTLSRREGYALFGFWVVFVLVELIVNT